MSKESTSHKAWFSLTVSEGKRLIALALKKNAAVAAALKDGTVLITKGTTNTYVAEALANVTLANGDYVNGHIKPANNDKSLEKPNIRSEYVLVNGTVSDSDFPSVLEDMGSHDVILKGANIINYALGQAGVIIVHPTGGTCGTITPIAAKNDIKIIIPVGLEKDSSMDIAVMSARSKKIKEETKGNAPYVWSLEGDLFTEIEAIKTYANVEVNVVGKGGIAGAEGAVSFLISGEKEELEKVLYIVKSVQGEKDYVK